MKFERADISMINNVTEAEIITEFNKFGEEEDDFVVLSKNDMNYIQAALSDFEEEEGMLLEYQEGSLDKHFHAIDTTDHFTHNNLLITRISICRHSNFTTEGAIAVCNFNF